MTNIASLVVVALSSIAISVSTTYSGISNTVSYDVSKLPTTIYLNDCNEETIRNYYSSLNGLGEDERKGNNLLKNLKPILKNGQKYYSYDGSGLWKMYEISDRDWAKSPATDLTYGTYDPATNTITGYKYGSSKSDAKNNPYIRGLYFDRSVDNQLRAWTNDGGSTTSHGDNREWCIDQEHIWPKSQGFNANGSGGARGDPMHLWPGDSDVNSSLHNDQFYGYVDINDAGTKAGKWSYGKNNYVGVSLTLGTSISSEKVFEPQDSDKGDIARAIFYLVARYNYLSGEDSDGIDQNNPNLELVQSNKLLPGYTSSTSETGKMGIMTDLLAWHHADPVDDFEIHRNNLLYVNFTNNRNPFIDFPDWVDYIWGTATYEGRAFKSYDNKPTGTANPASDSISKFAEGGGGGGGGGDSSSSEEPVTPTNNKKMDIKTILLIAGISAGVIVVAAVLVIIFVNANKRGKKKMLKTGKKIVKKAAKSNKKK